MALYPITNVRYIIDNNQVYPVGQCIYLVVVLFGTILKRAWVYIISSKNNLSQGNTAQFIKKSVSLALIGMKEYDMSSTPRTYC